MAQVIVAIQMVLEEKFVYKHDVHPLRAVGTEGLLRYRRRGGGEAERSRGAGSRKPSLGRGRRRQKGVLLWRFGSHGARRVSWTGSPGWCLEPAPI